MAFTSGYAGSAATESSGTHDWSDLAEAVGADDSTTADVSIAVTFASLPNEHDSYYLACDTFGLSVGSVSVRPSAISVIVRARSTTDLVPARLYVLLRLPDGTICPTPPSGQLVDTDNNFDYYTFGGDLFGFASGQLPYTVLEHADFAVLVKVENTSGLTCTTTCGVDSVQMVVTYEVTPDEPPPPFADDEDIKFLSHRVKRRFFI